MSNLSLVRLRKMRFWLEQLEIIKKFYIKYSAKKYTNIINKIQNGLTCIVIRKLTGGLTVNCF